MSFFCTLILFAVSLPPQLWAQTCQEFLNGGSWGGIPSKAIKNGYQVTVSNLPSPTYYSASWGQAITVPQRFTVFKVTFLIATKNFTSIARFKLGLVSTVPVVEEEFPVTIVPRRFSVFYRHNDYVLQSRPHFFLSWYPGDYLIYNLSMSTCGVDPCHHSFGDGGFDEADTNLVWTLTDTANLTDGLGLRNINSRLTVTTVRTGNLAGSAYIRAVCATGRPG
eukprot:TRINITY_DN8852_c0_g1_i2.p1 TRINITY_DN8852_c0_g1~~TRINITY_DN8852_c0_g1_i2.p1  ORF type:complete len:229 (-),score=12.18 TRINITY_DN8852_c0_g1_i2:109-774(-)